jgi:hypothetical protein
MPILIASAVLIIPPLLRIISIAFLHAVGGILSPDMDINALTNLLLRALLSNILKKSRKMLKS